MILFVAVLSEIFLEAMVDTSAKMPCSVLQKTDDNVEFIFWYKNDGVNALYTLDARSRPLGEASHVRNETVDYQWSATELTKVNLIVIVPPKKLIIRDDSGQEVREIAGPYKERSTVSLSCEAQKVQYKIKLEDYQLSRHPSAPNVTWWRDNKPWDSTSKKYSTGVLNDMKLINLSRLRTSSLHSTARRRTPSSPPQLFEPSS
ncbi:hemicentin-2 [Caerostris extrusa]|uniref:Hemicentin-2 n=1 Tax=Caerostris extrusa TaxID=172846 RepID=A0AAV4WAJ0_CAEEX|nr:hemicentin-2 [Caerostris extrusa]